MFEWIQDTVNTVPFVLVDYNNNEVTGLGSNFTLELSKNGGSFSLSTGTKGEIGNGWYYYIATAAEASAPGVVAIRVTAVGAVQQNMIAVVTQIPSKVWDVAVRTLTMSGVSVAAAISGATINVQRGDTLVIAIDSLGSLATYTSLDFTIKKSKSDSDDKALIRIRKNFSGVDDGLLRLNGTGNRPAVNGSITIDDAGAGTITITLAAEETDDLERASALYWDLQKIVAGVVTTMRYGTANVIEDVTRAIS